MAETASSASWLAQSLHETRQECRKLQDLHEAACRRIEELEARGAAQLEEKAELQRRLEAVFHDRDVLVSGSRKELDCLLENFARDERTIAQLKAKLAEALGQAERLKNELAETRKALRFTPEDRKAMEERLVELKALLAAAVEEGGKSLVLKEDAGARVIELEERVKAMKADQMTAASVAARAARGLRGRLEKALAELSECRALLEEEGRRRREEADSTERRLAEAEASRREEAASGQWRLTEAEASRREEAACAQRRLAEVNAAREAVLASERQKVEELAALNRSLVETRAALFAARQEADGLKQSFAGLQERLKEAEARADELALSGQAAAPAAASLPSALEPAFEPSWLKVLETLGVGLAAAFARLRKIPLASLPEGHKALLKLAATSLVQTTDTLKVLKDFLDESGPAPEEGPLGPVLESVLALWEPSFKTKKAAIVRHLDAKPPAVLRHPDSLRTALYQVVRNAFEALPAGGRLTVRLEREASGQVLLSFSDTGAGFSKKALPRLFEPFFSTRSGHLGLGLALARRTLRRSGGDVEAGNAPAGGARVVFRFAQPALPPVSDLDS